jgi:hypothetical protein
MSEGKTESEGKDNIVLCGANSYNKKYYLNPGFANLPEQIRRELKIMCVTFTEDAGGILTMVFTPDGKLHFDVRCAPGDGNFDEIACEMKISEFQNNREELLNELELFFKVVFLGYKV